VFGIKGDVRDNVWFFEDHIIVYTCGDNIVIYDLQKKTQKFINSNGGTGTEAQQGKEKDGTLTSLPI
jgi:hypothetical protein